ncbi:hypothetical protein HJG60_008885 [Phyllostomus discolor]|uniref:Uncharacterized protein n=1 Tax=Phyllostomus discolor TaxID=89673 RepID=A0A833YUA0_9CHIR|nr:hypothetical protein HJG60_008885 [Phyllostomus discolor]
MRSFPTLSFVCVWASQQTGYNIPRNPICPSAHPARGGHQGSPEARLTLGRCRGGTNTKDSPNRGVPVTVPPLHWGLSSLHCGRRGPKPMQSPASSSLAQPSPVLPVPPTGHTRPGNPHAPYWFLHGTRPPARLHVPSQPE